MTTITLLSADELARCCPPTPTDEDAGFGALATDQGNLPLKLLGVSAKITGLVAETQVRQTFVNTLSVPIEATYVFPLPSRAAVSRFRFEVGERVIEGELKERGEARRVYQQAIQSGHRAAITEEERPGVFTMRVGNLMPGDEATVHLTLSGPLAFDQGEATYRFPLVVAPRYMPGSALPGGSVGSGTALDTDAVPDASRISPPVLLPGFPNPVRLSLEVEVDRDLSLRSLKSSLHAVTLEQESGAKTVRLQPGERLNRDFVLRLGLGSEEVSTSLTLHPDPAQKDEGTFQLVLLPPQSVSRAERARDVVFVLDRSGSMGGWKMIAARRACARMLDTLTDRDRFGVLAFDSSVERPPTLAARGLIPATNRNRFRAVEYLAGVEARGGTEMAQPLQQAVDELLEGERGDRERILILITDGQVGNEDQILRTLGDRFAQLRVFTLGIDRAVNEGFLQRMADLGGGACELVESESRLDEVMDSVHRRIATPVLTEVRLEGQGITLEADSLTPARLPDLFAGSPVRIQGRYRASASAAGSISLRAKDARGGLWTGTVPGERTTNAALTRTWARAQVRTLEDRYAIEGGSDLVQRIVALSLRHTVLCKFTSFVAVDRHEVVNEGGQQHSINQAVEQPEGWSEECLASAPLMLCDDSDPFAAPADAFSSSSMAPPSASMPFASAPSSDPFGAPGGDPFGGFAASMPPPAAPSSRRRSAPKKSRREAQAPQPEARQDRAGKGGGGSPKKPEQGLMRSLWDKVAGKSQATPNEPAPAAPDSVWANASAGDDAKEDKKDRAPGSPASEEPLELKADLKAEVDKLLALSADGGSPRRLLEAIRRLVDDLERTNADASLLSALRELQDRLTQALSAGDPPASEAKALLADARRVLEQHKSKTAVARDQSFWF